MTDINSYNKPDHERGPYHDLGEDISLIELLFFAYRDFTSDPDAILAKYGFGRAHHRVLHFVYRNPGLTVADLLNILNITKQSLARVLKQLIDSGFVEQKHGPHDRRQRLLYTTADGRRLANQLLEPQCRRIDKAFRKLGPEARETISKFLLEMIDRTEQLDIMKLTGKEQTD